MRLTFMLPVAMFVLVFSACRKQYPYPPPPSAAARKILLKDITIPGLPSPFYHFEYNPDSTVSKVAFDDDLATYTVLYTNNKIAEMRNNAGGPDFLNHDTLRYVYDGTGKVRVIHFINRSGVIFRRVHFVYNGDRVTAINWEQGVDDHFVTDRTLTFGYYADGNVKTIATHDADPQGSTAGSNSTTLFEQYDDKFNVDDFSLVHSGINDHLFLLQGFRLQKNNPGKVTFTQDSHVNDNIVLNTYTYNNDSTPSLKKGAQTFIGSALPGQTFSISTHYTYY